MNCLWCNQAFMENMSALEILKFTSIVPSYICPACLKLFQPIQPENACLICCKQQTTKQICGDCQYWRSQFPNETLKHRALFYYTQEMKDYFQAFKGNGDYRLHRLFTKQLRQVFHRSSGNLYCVVPSDARKLKQRGFNPAESLFREFVSLTPLLEKLPTQKAQAQKSRQERFQSPRFFNFVGNQRQLVRAKQVLLLDDIYTTGTTFMHARAVIRAAGFTGNIQTFSLVRA